MGYRRDACVVGDDRVHLGARSEDDIDARVGCTVDAQDLDVQRRYVEVGAERRVLAEPQARRVVDDLGRELVAERAAVDDEEVEARQSARAAE